MRRVTVKIGFVVLFAFVMAMPLVNRSEHAGAGPSVPSPVADTCIVVPAAPPAVVTINGRTFKFESGSVVAIKVAEPGGTLLAFAGGNMAKAKKMALAN